MAGNDTVANSDGESSSPQVLDYRQVTTRAWPAEPFDSNVAPAVIMTIWFFPLGIIALGFALAAEYKFRKGKFAAANLLAKWAMRITVFTVFASLFLLGGWVIISQLFQ